VSYSRAQALLSRGMGKATPQITSVAVDEYNEATTQLGRSIPTGTPSGETTGGEGEKESVRVRVRARQRESG
jgi:hypothetical protein